MRRNGTRLFKNPPQPHMCIQDSIQGTTVPCYVNVLSWEKVGMPLKPSQPVPLYGGMRVRPPRTKEAVVFAVMANPEVLKVNGKYAQDPKKRSSLIELLLDFVETVNAGVMFTRQYTILKDRDITGELKEVWNAVQAKRDMEQPPVQQETWIDAQPPVPQYPQYQDHQQQDYVSQPPQYHSSIAYGRAMSNDGMHYESYSHQPQNSVMPQNDQMYQPGQIMQQQYHGNVPRIAQDRYNYRERGRENIVQSMPQQNCPAYPTPQYQFQQLPRQMVPQYVNSNVHPNANLSYNPTTNANVNPGMNANLAAPFQSFITYQQRMDNTMHVDMRRMQPQQQQIHLNHVQPVLQYEPTTSFNFQTSSSIKVLRLGRLHMGVAQKNNASKRQMNSPTHSKQSSCTNCQSKDTPDSGTKPKSPVKVLQRESALNDRQDAINHAFTDNSKTPAERGSVEETRSVQVTDLDEEVKKNDFDGDAHESSRKPNDTRTFDSTVTTGRDALYLVEDVAPSEEKARETRAADVPNGQNPSEQKCSKSKVISYKVNKRKDNTENNRTIRIRFVSDQKNDSPKRSQTTVNSIIKSVFKIHPGMSGEESSGKRKTNGQAKNNAKANGENDEVQHGYTILKKSESTTQEEVATELAQISIQDCKDAAEVSPVVS